jgi:hypothetical protein
MPNQAPGDLEDHSEVNVIEMKGDGAILRRNPKGDRDSP